MSGTKQAKPPVGTAAAFAMSPGELVDRLRTGGLLKSDRGIPVALHVSSDLAGDIGGLLSTDYQQVDGAALLAGFDDAWADVCSKLPAGHYHDSGSGLTKVAWIVVRATRPAKVVETGVAQGGTSAMILRALDLNNYGHLYSIDLPELRFIRDGRVGSVVPEHLVGRWTYIRGASHRKLVPLLNKLGSIDVFLHDSLHTDANMRFELETGWQHLREGGVLLSDDVNMNRAFLEVAGLRTKWMLANAEPTKDGAYGIALRRPGSPSMRRDDVQRDELAQRRASHASSAGSAPL